MVVEIKKTFSILLLALLSFNIQASSNYSTYNNLVKSFKGLYIDRDQSIDRVYFTQEVGSELEEAEFLWQDLSLVNADLANRYKLNLDRFLKTINLFPTEINDPNNLASGFYALYLFTTIAAESEEEIVLTKESLIILLDGLKKEPYNVTVPSEVEQIVSQIDQISISPIEIEGHLYSQMLFRTKTRDRN